MQYLVRVTIHNGTYAEYENLHQRMQAYGFQRYIKSDDGRYYWLPDATYVGDRSEDGSAVQKQVAHLAAASAPSKTAPEVLVCLRGNAWWSGLRNAK